MKFVNLHGSHTTFSIFDGLGFPEDHMRFAYDNGLDAIAITDHGNMNAFTYQLEAKEKMLKEGKKIKCIYGIECYYIPSMAEWKRDYEEAQKEKKKIKLDEMLPEDETAARKKIKNKLNRRAHLVLLAQNKIGLRNLFRLVTESYKEDNFYRYPRVDDKLLRKYNEGILASSACLGGIAAQDYWNFKDLGRERVMEALEKTMLNFLNIFGDRWYGEVQWNAIKEQHELNQFVIEVCNKYGIPVISTADAHYPTPEDWKNRELYKRLGWISKTGKDRPDWLSDELPKSVEEIGYELYPKNGQQMWDAYKKYSKEAGFKYDDEFIRETITRTYQIAHERIEEFEPDRQVRLPSFIVPEGTTADRELTRLVKEGLKEKGLYENQEYVDRAIYEMDVIKKREFSKYFLTMKVIADETRSIMFEGPGRGSSCSSLVSYLLKITQVDPLKYHLQFERFLSIDSSGMPDIDFDCAKAPDLKEYLKEKWGRYSVIPISNYNTLKLRSLIKDISKFYGIDFQEVNAVTTAMLDEATPEAKKKHGITAGVYDPTFEEVKEYSGTLKSFFKKYPEVAVQVEALHGNVRSLSTHAGGVLFADDLRDQMPLISLGGGGNYQTPWAEGQNVRHLEPLGFIKFDLLGLSSLEMIQGAIERILKRDRNKPSYKEIRKFYEENLLPQGNLYDDQKVWENVFHQGKWMGIFQFTGDGAQEFCMKVRPRSIGELSDITSIYRPSALQANVHKKYINARQGQEDEDIHPILRELLKETHGYIIYQEQLARVAHKLGKDIDLAEANKLRKLFTKKGTGSKKGQLDAIKEKFLQGCQEKNISQREAKQIWKTLEYFSGYGFCLAHAVPYSIISYMCAWLFTYYPAEWACAFLDKEPEKKKQLAIALAKQYGFKIKEADINLSSDRWEVYSRDNKELIQPLSSLKGLGSTAEEEILLNRPFDSIEDLLFHPEVSYRRLNKRALDVLVRSQALNSLMDERFENLRHFHECVVENRPKKRDKFEETIQKYKDTEDFDEKDKFRFKIMYNGIYPIDFVLTEEARAAIERYDTPPISHYTEMETLCWAIPIAVSQRLTKTGRNYYIIEVIDEYMKQYTIRCWNIDPQKDKIFVNRPYRINLQYEEDWGFKTTGPINNNWCLLA